MTHRRIAERFNARLPVATTTFPRLLWQVLLMLYKAARDESARLRGRDRRVFPNVTLDGP
jgi:hypothetical protein